MNRLKQCPEKNNAQVTQKIIQNLLPIMIQGYTEQRYSQYEVIKRMSKYLLSSTSQFQFQH